MARHYHHNPKSNLNLTTRWKKPAEIVEGIHFNRRKPRNAEVERKQKGTTLLTVGNDYDERIPDITPEND